MGVDTHIITAHATLPLLLRGDRGLLVEMTDGTAEVNASYRSRSASSTTSSRRT